MLRAAVFILLNALLPRYRQACALAVHSINKPFCPHFFLTAPIFTSSPSLALAEFFIAASAMNEANPSKAPVPHPPAVMHLGACTTWASALADGFASPATPAPLGEVAASFSADKAIAPLTSGSAAICSLCTAASFA